VLRVLTDEGFDWDINEGLLRVAPGIDLVTAQALGLVGSPDPVILERAARDGRVLLTQDLKTMPPFAYERVRHGLAMPGVFAMRQSLPIGRAIDDLLILIECSLEGEWEGQVRYLPL
jgi:hypothetical protein